MDFLKSLFYSSQPKAPPKSAGCIFTDGNLILAGYQPKGPFISGIGGSSNKDEPPIITAMREVVEELLDINPCDDLLNHLEGLRYTRKIVNGSYTIFVYSFIDLATILQLVKNYNPKTHLYEKFPTTVQDLVFNRRIANIEVSHLCILPLKKILKFDKYFISDLLML